MTSRTSQLFYRHILGILTEEERIELDEIVRHDPVAAKFMEQLEDKGDLHKEFGMYGLINTENAYWRTQTKINEIRRRRRLQTAWKVAAVLIVIIGLAIWQFIPLPNMDSHQDSTPTAIAKADEIKNDKTMARISFPDGETCELTSGQDGQPVSKIMQSIPSHKGSGVGKKGNSDVCLDVPRGREFKIVLEDSTEVWLNSDSQLRYPVSFADNERRVSVTGEVYMSVKKDASRPFYVESSGQEVRVYGTTFNIKAYPDERYVYITLETGSIALRQLSGEGGELILSPGNQAVYDPAESKVDMKTVNPDKISSWHQGRFVFEEQPLGNILRDMSRWYDFEFKFEDEGIENLVFMGTIPRYTDFKTALLTLEMCGDVEFKVADNTVIARKKRQ